MNNEEKARAYDEALEKVKPLYEQAKRDGNPIWSTYEYLIPELAENEDEKVRKALIEGVRQIRCKGDVTQEQMIAYLEKQKDNQYFIGYAKGYSDGQLNPKQKEKSFKDFIEDFPYIAQKEQNEESSKFELKTPEWVHKGWDDEYMINTVIGRYSLHAEVAKKRGDTHDYNLSKSMENWLRNVVKPLILEKQKEPAPVPDKFSGLKSLMLQYLQTAANRKDDVEIEDDTDLWGRKILDYVWKQDEKQKEPNLRDFIDNFPYDDEQKEQKLHLTVSGKEVYKICPRCKSRMIRDDSKVYTSMPPQYGYKCPKCGEMEFDTIMYDNPEMEEQKPADEQFPPLEGLDAIKAKYYDDGFKNGFDEGVESVKPAEWDDYTKTNLDRALQIIKKAKGNLQGYQSDDGIYECDKAIECLEHFLYRGLEIEKPAEWSEDEERLIKTSISFLKDFADKGYENAVECIDWLKSKLNGNTCK